MELISGGEEEADDGAGEEGFAVYFFEMTMVDDRQGDKGQGHAEEIEEEGRCVLDGVFDEDEGCAPDVTTARSRMWARVEGLRRRSNYLFFLFRMGETR